MNVALEEISSCRKRLKIEVPADRVNQEWDKVTTAFQAQASIPGFRPGKAPRGVVEKRYSKDIEEELKRSLVPDVFREVVKSKNLRVVAFPRIEDLSYQKGMSMSFSTVVDLAPEFPLPDYKSIRVARKAPEAVEEKHIDEVMERFGSQFADYKTVEGREAKENDFVVVDYTGTSEGKSIKEIVPDLPALAENNNFWIWLKADAFLPGFCEQLYGMKVGETRTVSVKFPSDYANEPLREKATEYSVTLKEIKDRVLPELNDEFCEKHFKRTASQLREDIRKDLETQRVGEAQSGQRRDLVDQLRGMVNFELPESVVEQETRRLVYDIVQENQMRGIPEQMLEEKKDEIYSNAATSAKERVKLNFLLTRIAEEEKIEVSTEEMQAELNMMAHRYQMPMDKLIERIRKNEALGEIESQILQRKTIDFLLQLATKE